jgi:predicted DNA-binding protein with PD1-like motif
MIGGYLMTGCQIYTAAEVTLSEIEGMRVTRQTDREGSG